MKNAVATCVSLVLWNSATKYATHFPAAKSVSASRSNVGLSTLRISRVQKVYFTEEEAALLLLEVSCPP
jgi:hypothetical protein